MASAKNCFQTLGIRSDLLFPFSTRFGNDDVNGCRPIKGKLDHSGAWCTNNITHPTLGIHVSKRESEVCSTYSHDKNSKPILIVCDNIQEISYVMLFQRVLLISFYELWGQQSLVNFNGPFPRQENFFCLEPISCAWELTRQRKIVCSR